RRTPGPGGKEIEEGFDSVRSGVTIPYSPEFADLETNRELLERLRSITGGKEITETDADLDDAVRAGDVYRPGLPRFKNLQPVWYWLVFLAGTLLFFDVAGRPAAPGPPAGGAATARPLGAV